MRTPLRYSPWLSGISGGQVFLKLESLQPTFSYKIRGALNAVLRLREELGDGVPPLVTASAGNHGRALAHAAQRAGLPLTVYVPADAPRTKVDAIRQAGAQLIACRDYDEAESRARRHGADGTALFISPYSHPDVIAGAGTVALEIAEELPGVQSIVVPIGGGGLISGVAIAAKAVTKESLITGVEIAASSPFTRSLAAGRIVRIDVQPTLADGLSGNLDPETITFAIVRASVDRVAMVNEADLQRAVGDLFREERLVVEGAGAIAVAAIAAGVVDCRERRTAVIVSGGNIDPDKFRQLI
jgi:threonine dehydratase